MIVVAAQEIRVQAFSGAEEFFACGHLGWEFSGMLGFSAGNSRVQGEVLTRRRSQLMRCRRKLTGPMGIYHAEENADQL